ncbi:MAG: universal stress protein [Bacteroidota bacterium]|nr:universal stress protein [Bacteroidota bacterium]
MKKILIIINESHVPHHAIKRAIDIAKESNSTLEALFIDDINGLNFGYPFPNDLYLTGTQASQKSRTEESVEELTNIAKVFKDECAEYSIECKIEIDKSVSIKHLINLSCFADLIIADSKSESDDYSFKDILADAHCPLLLTSKNAESIEKIFFAYDGSASNMYAIKMFSYIFPEYKNLPVQFFQITSADVVEIRHLEEIKSWTSKHFTDINFKLVTGSIRKELVDYVKQDSEKAIVIMGAYSRSAMSQLFLKSMAESVINETDATLFIAHQ